MNLVIVESPAKAKTIGKYLGKGFTVKASFGHVRDLPKSKIGVDINNAFTPEYVIPPKATKALAVLQKEAKKADHIYFATDEDREGEAIAWHLAEALHADPKKSSRITFAEITKTALQYAIEHPRAINQQLVDAQQARRILDRLVGYELSPFLWSKVRRGLSAGRVQSVAVRLIVEKEREIEAFKAEEFWSIEADVDAQRGSFLAKLRTKDGKLLEKFALKDNAAADEVVRAVTNIPWTVEDVTESQVKRSPAAPFTTSTLQQAAANRLGFSAKKTMTLAQRLYEGIELGDEGATGLITYMRTDSVNLAQEAILGIRQYVEKTFGNDHLPETPRIYKTKSRGAQEAHEAVRPTDVFRTPDAIKSHVEYDMWRLYDLIWRQAVACQMLEATFASVKADLRAGVYGFRATGSRVLFSGYLAVTGVDAKKEVILPPLSKNEAVTTRAIRPLQHFTQPPARYSEASLVKALEEHGIGRPSTYAPTIDTIQQRGYVEKNMEDKRFRPTDVGTIVNDILVAHFPEIVDIQFTARMEDNLDNIADGSKTMTPVLKDFYDPFHKNLEVKTETLSRSELTDKPTDLKCPDCGKPVLLRLGRNGQFYGCSGYPDCKYTAPYKEDEKTAIETAPTGKTCPKCGKDLIVKRGRFGVFLGCSGYPDCKHTERIEKKTGLTCPTCRQGDVVERRSKKRGKAFYGCNRYPDCDFVLWNKPTGELCPTCKNPLVYQKKNIIGCSNKECEFEPKEVSSVEE